MRILIVEDDIALGLFLQRGLRLEGYETQIATDGQSGLCYALEGGFDLILLDLSLPQKDGLEVLREIRAGAVDVSVMVLTGRNATEDRVRCFDLGADHLLLKPFSFVELTARCRSVMRLRERFSDPTLRQGDLELNRMQRKVVRSGRNVELTVKEFALLEYLMLARGRTCSRSELLKEVWQMSPDAGTNVVDVYVNYLRKKLGSGLAEDLSLGDAVPANAPVIETVRGEGYSLSCVGNRRPARAVRLPLRGLGVAGFGKALKSSVFQQGEMASA